MSRITRTLRLVSVYLASRCVSVLRYIMHNVYTQAHHNLAHRVHTPRRDPHLVVCVRMTAPICHMSRRDHVHYRDTLYSRDRSRRT